ncbi:MAG: GNAT family N-acetyltransferase [Caldilineaceae bacterium]
MTTITIRAARPEDKEKIIEVEAKSTPNLRYVPQVFAEFMAHARGEFSVAEVDGELAACAKFTVLPDHSAWLETLRVIPERQGLGVGKRLYERFFEIARREGVATMRMYTGVKNAVSKGLAERFGFQPAATFYGAWQACADAPIAGPSASWQPVTDPPAPRRLSCRTVRIGKDIW